MIGALGGPGRARHHASREHTDSPRRHPATCHRSPRRLHMQWTTPAATDLRFGFEITMYVAAR